MEIRQFRYSMDNLSYLVSHEGQAVVIDGGAVDAICDHARAQGLEITQITHTHAHPDHTCGSTELTARTGAAAVDHRLLAQAGRFDLNGAEIRVHHTPGHTRDSVVFECDGALITGDTLFNGTVGNCFSDDMRTFFESLTTLMAFPPSTRIYAGHDYVRDAMAFARVVTPDHPHLKAYLGQYDPDHVVTTLADELNVDPYLRFDAPDIIAFLKRKGLPVTSAFERWEGMMQFG
ncbi:MAG: MBL fold metallo-hydrolase [Desulfosarcinaceae bacterium]|nr:MBL fold metallo-hydrolase [Desulfosarcinaceae bacterium]